MLMYTQASSTSTYFSANLELAVGQLRTVPDNIDDFLDLPMSDDLFGSDASLDESACCVEHDKEDGGENGKILHGWKTRVVVGYGTDDMRSTSEAEKDPRRTTAPFSALAAWRARLKNCANGAAGDTRGSATEKAPGRQRCCQSHSFLWPRVPASTPARCCQERYRNTR